MHLNGEGLKVACDRSGSFNYPKGLNILDDAMLCICNKSISTLEEDDGRRSTKR
ncbi:enoyl-CoA hydratase [Sesbania bispinosa]|nr:enoyl-CoA hydratase [Sesbania bispinosa]